MATCESPKDWPASSESSVIGRAQRAFGRLQKSLGGRMHWELRIAYRACAALARIVAEQQQNILNVSESCQEATSFAAGELARMEAEVAELRGERDAARDQREAALHDVAVANLELTKVQAQYDVVLGMLEAAAPWTNLLLETPANYLQWMAQAGDVVIQHRLDLRQVQSERKELRDQVLRLQADLEATRRDKAALEKQLAALKATAGRG